MDIKSLTGLISAYIDLAGILALLLGIVVAFTLFGLTLLQTRGDTGAYRGLRRGIGKAILVGLELLVAADIIRSVAISPSFATVGVLGLIVVIRTFLSWSLELEITGRWPWRGSQLPSNDVALTVTPAVGAPIPHAETEQAANVESTRKHQ
jgi:uncharacterized membrane protein